MAVFVRIRAWRTRRKERKAERLIALAAVSPEARAAADIAREINDRAGYAPSHAGEEGKKHY
jgi:hypothetical protein